MDVNDVRWAPAKAVQAADELIKLKNNKGPWEVIEKVIEMWKSTNPTDYKSYIIQLEDMKSRGKVANVGNKHFTHTSKDKATGGILRHELDIPLKVTYMIRKIYPDLQMDKKFFKKWARKFPQMVISKRV